MLSADRSHDAAATMTPILPPPDAMIDLLPDAVCVVDAEGRFLFVSAGFERILGYAPAEVIGRRAFDFVHEEDRASTMAQAAQIMDGAMQRHFRNRYRHKAGHLVDMQWSATWHPSHGVRIGVGREVTELRRAEQQLEYLAHHDALTGLLNRHALHRALEQALDEARRTGGGLSLLFIDLDGFKAANDAGGHEAGDRLLQSVAACLRQSLRPGDCAGRMGGDEFVVLLPGCVDVDGAAAVADGIRTRLRLIAAVAADLHTGIDASIGIACFPAHGQDARALLAHADHAMYGVKRRRCAMPVA